MTRAPRMSAGVLLLIALAAFSSTARSQGVPEGQAPPTVEQPLRQGLEVADVTLDGHALFRIRGITAFPADRRAGMIADRMREVARDRTVDISDTRLEQTLDGIAILIADQHIVTLVQLDADLEGLTLDQMSRIYSVRIGEAIQAWRLARDPGRLLRSGLLVLAGGILLLGFLFVLRRLYRGFSRFVERHWAARGRGISVQSVEVVRSERLRAFALGGVRLVAIAAGLAVFYAYLNASLAAFPWTRGFARSLLGYVTDPVLTIGTGILEAVPGLLFILIAWLFTRFLLRLIKSLFDSIEQGRTTYRGFEPEWAKSTFRLVRFLVIVIFLIMIFPYIPGSNTDAFKGMSLFLGLVLSLGSSSVISNVVAGFGMTYRRAFKVGDRIMVDGSVGDVTEMRLLVTHLRSPKNEEIIVPNTLILAGNVTNYSSIARKEGLILHTTVGIGYETPWRQVEAMLKEAARRTPGLEADPPPFVLQKLLGDFAVTYEINAFTREPRLMHATYTNLHANILDVFNEYGIQVMTPAYEGDPEVPKLVAKEDWFAAPAPRGTAESAAGEI